MKDLIALVADIDIEYTLRGLFSRPKAMAIRQITFDVFRHPRRDPGCLGESADFLRASTKNYEHAIVVFDHEGCGRENETAADLQKMLSMQFHNTGWNDRALPIVLVPELEIWVWSNSPQVDVALNWAGRQPPIHQWLINAGWIDADALKPRRPKEAMHAALRLVKKVPSAAIFEQLGRTVSLKRCVDPAFQRLTAAFQQWFAE